MSIPSFSLFLYFSLVTCGFARDTITFGNPINSSGVPLISANEKFALGFFSPNNNTTTPSSQYVGIWYYRLKPRTIVWVAKRDFSLPNSTIWVFGIGKDGNLMLSDGRGQLKQVTHVVNVNSDPSLFTLKLLDSGNLVLNEVSSDRVIWESFRHPTDTFLPGMKISETLKLSSWTSRQDPKPGRFQFGQVPENNDQYIISKNEALPYWKSSKLSSDQILPFISFMLHNISSSRIGGSEYCTILNRRGANCNKTLTLSNYDYNNTRLVMDFDGKLQFFKWDYPRKVWSLIWSEPEDRCSVFEYCGKFGSCNNQNRVPCKCLPGFEPQSPDNWNTGDFSGGCRRKSSVSGRGDEKDEAFVKLSMTKVQKPDSEFAVKDQNECQSRCLEISNCHAYSYGNVETYQRSFTCMIWIEDLNNIQESYTNRGFDLYLRLRRSDLGHRTCEICGTNIIPYPLSTGPSCGDPNYSTFKCHNETGTGEIIFNASRQTYRVTSMNAEKQSFSIQVQKCKRSDSAEKLLKLPGSSPFFVNSKCNPKRGVSEESKWFYEIEIGWNPPLNPICNSSEDCKDWANSSCNVAEDGKNRCTCNPLFQWEPNSSCIWDPKYTANPPLEKRKSLFSIFLGVTATMMFILCAALAFYYERRRRTMVRTQGNLELNAYNIERQVIDFINSGEFREDDKKDIEVPYFDLESILVATDNFAETNKLGQGGFGPVYKGKLPRGQEIAIKRLSRGSGQGLEEFKNEVVLIAKLQHRNLVRLLGYCVQGYEKMLIYEYLPNKSLDSFLFDRTRCVLLNWEKRIDIILGVGRGMLYLHQDSRLRIIHRDLKTSNILLDEEMNPKISDFGLARIFEGKQIEGSTDRVVGTYGYMSPEYALDGFFSFKSDVFSFGVVLLETISGKRNTGFYQAEKPLSLLGYAWRLWEEGRALDLAEQGLRQSCNTNEFLRCVHVGLLCVQEDPSDRPTMSNVLFMIGSETATLPIPKQPAYVVRRSILSSSASSSTSSKQQWNTEFTTLEEGR